MTGGPGGIALWLGYAGQSVRAQLQYRVSFALMTLGQFLTSGVEALGVWALFERFGQLGAWRMEQVFLFYAVVTIAFALADIVSRGFDQFGSHYVKTGDFDRLLLRPRAPELQVAGHEFALYRLGRVAQGLLVGGIAIWLLQPAWGAAELAVLAFAVLGGMALFMGLMVLQATLAFWTVESLEVMNTLTYGGVETARYPLAIYAPWFRRLFTFVVPLGCVTYFPVVFVLGVADPLGTSRLFQALAPAAGFAFLALSVVAFRVGVRRYASTGT